CYMNKKLLFLFPALLGLFLSSCGGGSNTSESESKKESEQSDVNESSEPVNTFSKPSRRFFAQRVKIRPQ
ncbi:MAG: hypothetical protein IJS21_02165, partial [Deltaproteobacteria bacterium]|nr:hypothetical protein [Deltaproteobacteria bacterium]